MPIAELSAACCLIAGIQIRMVAAAAMLMVLNFHIATSAFSSPAFFRDGTGLPVLGALLALAVAGNATPLSARLSYRQPSDVSVKGAPYWPAP